MTEKRRCNYMIVPLPAGQKAKGDVVLTGGSPGPA